MPASARALLRKAFHKLDRGGEGVVDLDVLAQHYNSSRYPRVADGTVRPADLLL